MPLLKLQGDPEIMARIKTDSKRTEFWWSVDLRKPLSQQHKALEELKKILNAFTLGSGAGLEGVCVLHQCGAFGKGAEIDMSRPLSKQGVGGKNNEIYVANPPRPPTPPMPTPDRRPLRHTLLSNVPPLSFVPVPHEEPQPEPEAFAPQPDPQPEAFVRRTMSTQKGQKVEGYALIERAPEEGLGLYIDGDLRFRGMHPDSPGMHAPGIAQYAGFRVASVNGVAVADVDDFDAAALADAKLLIHFVRCDGDGELLNPGGEVPFEHEPGEAFGLRITAGLVMYDVDEGSAAERCGLAQYLGCRIAAVDSCPVSTVPELAACIEGAGAMQLLFAAEEHRVDPADGFPCTLREFVDKWGGTVQWDAAEAYAWPDGSTHQCSQCDAMGQTVPLDVAEAAAEAASRPAFAATQNAYEHCSRQSSVLSAGALPPRTADAAVSACQSLELLAEATQRGMGSRAGSTARRSVMFLPTRSSTASQLASVRSRTTPPAVLRAASRFRSGLYSLRSRRASARSGANPALLALLSEQEAQICHLRELAAARPAPAPPEQDPVQAPPDGLPAGIEDDLRRQLSGLRRGMAAMQAQLSEPLHGPPPELPGHAPPPPALPVMPAAMVRGTAPRGVPPRAPAAPPPPAAGDDGECAAVIARLHACAEMLLHLRPPAAGERGEGPAGAPRADARVAVWRRVESLVAGPSAPAGPAPAAPPPLAVPASPDERARRLDEISQAICALRAEVLRVASPSPRRGVRTPAADPDPRGVSPPRPPVAAATASPSQVPTADAQGAAGWRRGLCDGVSRYTSPPRPGASPLPPRRTTTPRAPPAPLPFVAPALLPPADLCGGPVWADV